MKKYIGLIFTVLLSGYAQAQNFSEQVKISGFQCDSRGAAIVLRSLDGDRELYLAENTTGVPQYLRMYEADCRGLIKNLSLRLTGKVLVANFQAEEFSREEEVYVPPRPCRTKCDEGYYEKKTYQYQRIETAIDGFRFFDELKLK